eukprot:gnl/MRDRNA2_/MRDRNA2_246846_c0_seq1.p1 gnl/MRDRNA2_/MRDRNA2_246846_c0~~gnl/MRDRNA2_/MRDRNA2_246846_c0_seq1.p1  ORF type:complete len:311 (-),score=26.30 gnl/MRDRNA2_/MRDRNA2_246846_c0_seq1:73-1005(-)
MVVRPMVWMGENLVQKVVVILSQCCFWTRHCWHRKRKRLPLDAPNEGLVAIARRIEVRPKKCSKQTSIFSIPSASAVQKSIAARCYILQFFLEREDDLEQAVMEDVQALSRESEGINEAETASLDLKCLFLSGEVFFSIRAEQSWTGAQLFAAALEQTRPAMFPRSFICTRGVINEHQTLETLGLTTGDALHVIVSSLASRYYGTAQAGCLFDDLDDTFEVEYILGIAENFRFDLILRVGKQHVVTLHGKLASEGHFVFHSSQPDVTVTLWLDDAGLVRLSDTGNWRCYQWQNFVVDYDGVEDLPLKPLN